MRFLQGYVKVFMRVAEISKMSRLEIVGRWILEVGEVGMEFNREWESVSEVEVGFIQFKCWRIIFNKFFYPLAFFVEHPLSSKCEQGGRGLQCMLRINCMITT